MVRNSFELTVIAQQWANKTKESIAMILEDFMIKNHISFQTLCKIMPIDEDILEDIMSGKSDMITMNELSAIIIALDLAVEVMPASVSPLHLGSGTSEENLLTEARQIENEKQEKEENNNESFGCGIIISDNPRLKEALEIFVNMFDTNPEAIDSFMKLFSKN